MQPMIAGKISNHRCGNKSTLFSRMKMMPIEYLNKVLIYLKQDLPDNGLGISIINDRIVF